MHHYIGHIEVYLEKLYNSLLSFLLGTVIKRPFLASEHRGRDPTWFSCGFQQGDNIGITSSNCRHYTLINSIMCSDSYPIPILSLFFLYHPFIPSFLIQRFFHFLVSFLFLLHACMYSHQASNTNSGYHVICKSISPL